MNLLSKENSLVLRGLAIIAIMLHNFLHNPKLGFSLENEMAFSVERVNHFYSHINYTLLNPYEWFSFLGWIGVAVFVFLTGYGVAKNAPPSSVQESFSYTKRQYVKLFVLLLPAFLLFVAGDVMEHKSLTDILKRFSYLTMMSNVAYPWVNCPPGVYWYFGLTFQFYLLYAFCGKNLKNTHLLCGSIITIALLGLLCSINQPELLSVYKHCFTGWFILFAIGFWMGRRNDLQINTCHSIAVDITAFLLAAALVVIMNRWMVTWLFVPIVALVFFIAGGLLILRTPVMKSFFIWTGKLSACIFVCHPVVRFAINKFMMHRLDNLTVIVLVYVIVTILVSMLYNQLYKRLLTITQNRI